MSPIEEVKWYFRIRWKRRRSPREREILARLIDAKTQEMKQMMHEHLDLTHLKGNWADDVAAYDKIHSQILQMADMLSAGIINQYPAKFK